MAFTFDQIFAADPSNTENVAGGATVTIFAPGDATMTPIAITAPDGSPLPNPIPVNENGFASAFAHATLDRVAWSGGGFTGFFTSYEGLKNVAIASQSAAGAAATDAASSAAAAQAAAGLVGAPADPAIAAAVSTADTQTRAALDSRYANGADTSGALAAKASTASVGAKADKSTMSGASDPLAYLDNVVILCDIPVRENGEVSWPQGFSINKAKDEIYVANQNGTELRIDVRTLSTGVRKSSKIATTEAGAFTEALPWFYNGNGDLCFIVWPKSGGAVPSAYAIFNYTLGTLGAQIPIYGFTRGDVSGNYLVTADAWTNTVTTFYVYDWTTVKAGTPNLVATIPVENTGATAAKNQGIAIVGSHLYLAEGSQTESPTLMVWDFTGKLKAVRQYSRAALQAAINTLKPGFLTNDAYTYEAEGATSLDGKLVTGQIVNNNPSVTADGRLLILQHNRIDGAQMVPQPVPGYVYDTGWVALTLNTGWTVAGGLPLQVRRIGNQVRLRGQVSNGDAATAGVFAAATTLPAGFRPAVTAVFAGSTNSTATQSVRVNSSGVLDLYTSVTTTAWRPVNGITFLID